MKKYDPNEFKKPKKSQSIYVFIGQLMAFLTVLFICLMLIVGIMWAVRYIGGL